MENYLFEGNISVKAAVMGGMREVSEIIVDEAKKDRDTQWILHRAAERGIPIVTASRAHIDSLASGHTHGGLLARCGARRFQQLKEIDRRGLLPGAHRRHRRPVQFRHDPAHALCGRLRWGDPAPAQLDLRRGDRRPAQAPAPANTFP